MKQALGTVIQVRTARGLSYVQYLGAKPVLGDLIRVLPGCFGDPLTQEELTQLVAGSEAYFEYVFTFTTLVRHGQATVVGTFDVPPHAAELPVVKFLNLMSDEVEWHIFDSQDGNGRVSYTSAELTEDERQLPFWEGVPTEVVIDRIANAWSPAQDTAIREKTLRELASSVGDAARAEPPRPCISVTMTLAEQWGSPADRRKFFAFEDAVLDALRAEGSVAAEVDHVVGEYAAQLFVLGSDVDALAAIARHTAASLSLQVDVSVHR